MITFTQVQEKREARAALADEARAVLTKAQEENRALTSEEEARFDQIHKDVESRRKEIERLERQLGVDADLTASADTRTVPGSDDAVTDPEDVPETRAGNSTPEVDWNDVIKRWGMEGPGALTAQERKLVTLGNEARGMYLEIKPTKAERAKLAKLERRAMSTTLTEGGDFIPEGFWPEIQRALLAFNGVRQAARVIRTSTGNDLPIPTVDDTSNTGALVAENTQVGEDDVVTGQVVLGAYKYTSNMVRVSHELMNDAAFDVGSLIVDVGGERIGRITEAHYTTGTGTNQPNGVVTASTLGATAAVNNAVTFDEFIDLKHSVDPSYRTSRQAGYMFNDATLAALKKLSVGSADARPLWQPGVAVGAPDTVDGSRYWINQHMADIGASAISALYGDFGRYWIRDVEGLRILRLVERFADFDQVAFILFFRTDSDLTTAGAIKHLVHPV